MTNFTTPQRQSLVGIVVLFANSLRKFISAFFPILIIWVYKIDEIGTAKVLLGLVFSLVVLGIIAYLNYWFFTFYIDETTQEFVIEKGVFNKTKITIQLSKIQQVTINQNIIHKIVGVHKLEIDSAGSDKKEVSISAISHALAVALKEKLTQESSSKNESRSGNTLETAEKNILKIRFLSLLKIGITANYMRSFALILLFVSWLVDTFSKIIDSEKIDETVEGYVSKLNVIQAGIMFFVGLILVIILINVIHTLVTYFNLTIERNKQSFQLKFGLLNTKNILVNPGKIQRLVVSQNYFQKKLDVLSVRIFQASSSAQAAEREKNKTEIPGCSETEKNLILQLIYNQLPEKGTDFYPNIRKLILSLVVFLVLPMVVFTVFYKQANFISLSNYGLLMVLYGCLVLVLQWFSYKNYRLFVNNNHIIKQSGAWDIDLEIIEPYKIQAIKTSQFFWQKSYNVGSVVLYTAGGSLKFSTTNFTNIKSLSNAWLYQIETSTKNWM